MLTRIGKEAGEIQFTNKIQQIIASLAIHTDLRIYVENNADFSQQVANVTY